mmetsp:Transcript_25702/g.65302  ORF Transcript_25702/g.65302 Transcript_25702/m.65302 type:complete len:305 (-) Transcript_25702:1182-2096(-)
MQIVQAGARLAEIVQRHALGEGRKACLPLGLHHGPALHVLHDQHHVGRAGRVNHLIQLDHVGVVQLLQHRNLALHAVQGVGLVHGRPDRWPAHSVERVHAAADALHELALGRRAADRGAQRGGRRGAGDRLIAGVARHAPPETLLRLLQRLDDERPVDHLDSVQLAVQRVEAQLDLAKGAPAQRLHHYVLVDACRARGIAPHLQLGGLLGQAADAAHAGLHLAQHLVVLQHQVLHRLLQRHQRAGLRGERARHAQQRLPPVKAPLPGLGLKIRDGTRPRYQAEARRVLAHRPVRARCVHVGNAC